MEFIEKLKSHPSPFVRIFVQPRETVQEQLAKPANPRLELLLLVLGGLGSIPTKFTAAASVSGLLNIVWVIIWVYLISWLTSLAGRKFLNGTANANEIRHAIIWSFIVVAARIPFIIVGFILPSLAPLITYLVLCPLTVWFLIVYFYALSAATGFGFWKAFINHALAALPIVIPVVILASLIYPLWIYPP